MEEISTIGVEMSMGSMSVPMLNIYVTRQPISADRTKEIPVGLAYKTCHKL